MLIYKDDKYNMIFFYKFGFIKEYCQLIQIFVFLYNFKILYIYVL